jgi:type I restriction enzyme R subunit
MSEYLTSELPAVELLKKLDYEHINGAENDPRESIHEVVLKDRLEASIRRLNPWMDDNGVSKCMHRLIKISSDSLMSVNNSLHKLITASPLADFSIAHPETKKHITPIIIDFKNSDNNDFLAVNQIKYFGTGKNSIPDIVLYVNGLPLAVIECKSSLNRNAIEESVSDLRYYQENSPELFYYNQICAGIYEVGGRYGSIGAKSTHYSEYKTDDTSELETLLFKKPTKQDILLYGLFSKESFLNIIRDFVIYETEEGRTIKKLPRYQQIRAVHKTLEKLKNESNGGVIWHTQGSGKSITMLYLAIKLKREENGFNNPTIIILTDRIDLDKQISDTFKRCGLPNVMRAGSVYELKTKLKDSYGKTITTTIHKFDEEMPNDMENVKPLTEAENVFVMVDEAHRSQYGLFAAYMRKLLPNAKYIAFTGTPIDKATKSTLHTFYGGDYIDKYTIKQSVEDGTTLPILYDIGIPELFIEKELMNKRFDEYFGDESEEKQELLKQKATSTASIQNSKERIKRISEHIVKHYCEKIYPDGFKAMIVCYSRAAAVEYKKALDDVIGNTFESRVILSQNTKKDPQEYEKYITPENVVQSTIMDYKLPFGDESSTGKDGKKKFCNIAFLIVCDMLLTGYDAPIAQVMYLDKPLKEHNLLQAIARVNRTREGKSYGLIVDYCGITQNLADALEVFSGDLEPSDVMTDLNSEKPKLDAAHDRLVKFFKEIKTDRTKERLKYIDEAAQMLEPEDVRDGFKTVLKAFNKAMDIVLPDPYAAKYGYDFKLYNEVRIKASVMYYDESLHLSSDDYKKLKKLMDEHLRASEVGHLLDEPVSIIDRQKFREELSKISDIKTRALTIENRIKHKISIEIEKNPEFYKPIAELLQDLIDKRKAGLISIAELLEEYEKMQEHILKHGNGGFASEQEFAVFKTLEKYLNGEASDFTSQIMKAAFAPITDSGGNIISGWHTKEGDMKEMRNSVKLLVKDKIGMKQASALALDVVEVLRKNA